MRVSGSYPVWTVKFEDGYDDDFNDVEVTVTAFEAEVECPPASYFGDPEIAEALEDLVLRSNFNAPQQERREQWGWIVETENGFEFIRLINDATNPCQVAVNPVPPQNTVAWVHTHPFEDGERIPPGLCPQAPEGGVYRSGPSGRDLFMGDFINDELGKSVPGYIIDPSGVTRFTTEQDPGERPRVKSEEEYAGCVVANTA